MSCNVCGSETLKELGQIGGKPISVTSEPHLCFLPAKIFYCQNCNHIQKVNSLTEISFIDSLYSNYSTYQVSEGNEQLVFLKEGLPKTRSYHVIEQCLSLLQESGNLLDIGTGIGVVLKSASHLLPKWNLFAFDLSDKYKKNILEIPGVVDFYSESLQNLPDVKFNLIVLWHCLEHISKPLEFLCTIREYLTEDGYLLIQVPDIHRTPFDLAVIDHCSHFTKSSLLKLFQRTGFAVAVDGDNWVHNCLTVLLKKRDRDDSPNIYPSTEALPPEKYFDWLNKTVDNFDYYIQNRKYAIFGTGVSGIWLSSQLSKAPAFFIDEDTKRIGNKISNVPIIRPQDVPKQIDIIMPFTEATGENIGLKMKKLYDNFNACNLIVSQPYT